MDRIGKGYALFLTLMIIMSGLTLLMVEPANAQSIPKPSVPEFTVAIIYSPYNETDPYTGATHQIDNGTLEIIIKNQPFTPQVYASINTNTSLFYNIQVKGHYIDNWQDIYSSGTFSYTPGWNNNNNYTWYDYAIQSNSEETIVPLPMWYPVGSEVDFRVQAIIANITEISLPNFLPDSGLRYHSPSDYTQKIAWTSVFPSEWITQTISILETSSSTSPSSSPTPTPTVPEFPATLGITVLTITALAVAVVSRRKHLTES